MCSPAAIASRTAASPLDQGPGGRAEDHPRAISLTGAHGEPCFLDGSVHGMLPDVDPPSENIVDRLRDGIRLHVLEVMPSEGRSMLEELRLDGLLVEYRTWRGRFISPIPRKVSLSHELQTLDRHRPAIAALASKFERGEDVTAHLSHRIHEPFKNLRAPALQHRTDRDSLLADWGIHHLHLGGLRRGDEVLFVFVTDDVAYFIDVKRHPKYENWAAKEIFATMVRNWPDAGLATELANLRPLSTPTDADRLALRDAGTLSLVDVGDKVYLPGRLGQTTAGTPVDVTREVDALLRRLAAFHPDPDRSITAAAIAAPAVDDDLPQPPPNATWFPLIDIVQRGFEEHCGFATALPDGTSTILRVGRLC
jgi:hypothetical protein